MLLIILGIEEGHDEESEGYVLNSFVDIEGLMLVVVCNG